MITNESVVHGFRHLETVAGIHYDKPTTEYHEAILALAQSFGMDNETVLATLQQLDDFVPKSEAQARSWVMIGLLIGLSVSQHASESE